MRRDIIEAPARATSSGAERVAVVEYFYRGVFAGMLLIVGAASLGAILMLPLRVSAAPVSLSSPTVLLTAAMVLATPFAFRSSWELYCVMRRRTAFQFAVAALAAMLLAHPLRSELWWPSCALLMLVALVAPPLRALACGLAVLLINLATHLVVGDLATTPAISIIGLWIGFGLWVSLSATLPDRIAAHLLRVELEHRRAPISIDAERATDVDVPDAEIVDPRALPAPRAAVDDRLGRLTARQLEVAALLADGLRYAEVAQCLAISTRQVQRHVAEAVRRLGVRNANQLVAVAVVAGLGRR